MARKLRFTFLCNESKRKIIALIATRLSRSQSDALRQIIAQKAEELGIKAPSSGDENVLSPNKETAPNSTDSTKVDKKSTEKNKSPPG